MRRVRSSVLQSVVRLSGVRDREVADVPAAALSFRGTGASSFGVSRVGRVAVVVLVLAGVLLVPAAASGAPKGTIAIFGQGDPDDPSVPPVSAPAGLAVHQGSGDVYVVDANNDRIQQFDQDGVFIRAWGSPGSAEGQFSFFGQYAGIAVAPDGSVYVADAGNNRIQKFQADGTFVSTWGWDVLPDGDPADPLDDPEIAFEVCTSGCQAGTADASDGAMSNPIGVAVNPTDGTVVVADQYNNRVQRFDADGNYQAQFPTNSPQSIAVDSAGGVYTVESFDSNVRKFAPDGTQEERFYQSFTSISALTVDPANDHLYLTQYQFDGNDFFGSEALELDPAGAVVDGHRFRRDTTDAFGVAVNSTSGRIYASQTYEDRIFIIDDPVHTAVIEPATNIGSRTATLHGTINPGGDLPISYHFELSSDGGATWTRVPETDSIAGSGTSDIAVSEEATGLDPNSDYLVRLVAANEFGSTVTSGEATFTTDAEPPDVETLGATQIRATSALLAGLVNPNTLETTYWFEWGTTSAYGEAVRLPGASAGNGENALTVVEQLTGLAPDTVYHFRLVAANAAGLSYGADRAFRTRAAVPAPPGRGYERVSPVGVSGVGAGIWYKSLAAVSNIGYAAHDRERFAVQGIRGAPLIDGPYSYADDYAFAERTPGGWLSQPASPRAYGGAPLTFHRMNGASEDLGLTTWGSNSHTVRVFPEMEPWDENIVGEVLLARQWDSPQYDVVGPTHPDQKVIRGDVGLANQPQALAADGSAIVAFGKGVRGLAGPGDPTRPEFGDVDPAANNVYLDKVAGSFTSIFPGDDGVRELVNVCTAGTVLPSGPCAAPGPGRDARVISSGGAAIGQYDADDPANSNTRGVVSSDGSRVFFMSPDPSVSGHGQPQLYVRQRNTDGSVITRWLSQTTVPGQNSSQLLGASFFEGASSDGDKLLFRSTGALTADDPNGSCGAPCVSGNASSLSTDLYLYDLPDGPDGDPSTPDADPTGGTLTRVSAGLNGDGDCNVQPNTLRWLSADGLRGYFTCAAPLAGVAAPSNGASTSPAGDVSDFNNANIYHYDASEGLEWSFVARVPTTGTFGACATTATRGNTPLSAGSDGTRVSVNNIGTCFRGTSDARLATFFTRAALTPDDAEPDSADMYAYDAVRGELTRISAPQGGAGGAYLCTPDSLPSPACNGDPGIGNPESNGGIPLRMLGVSDASGGRSAAAYFESKSRLVAEDSDDAYDVYQWADGELTLLTPGASPTDGQLYVGNDRSGTNVYIATRDRLTWEDSDAALDVYTVRVGGGFPQPVLPAVCAVLVDACQGPGVGAESGVGSATARPRDGEGNATAPVRGKVSIKGLTASQRKTLGAGRRVRVSVAVNVAGKVRLRGSARVGKATRRVLFGRASARAAGTVRIRVRLNAAGRRQLARTGSLSIALRAVFDKAPQAAVRTVRVAKPTPKRRPHARRATVPATANGR
jgi:sugar lactone lactonase YvrE